MVKADNIITELVEQESIIDDECKQRIARFLEQEGDGVRKEAEKESTNIICKAREEYVRRLSRFLEEEEEKIRKQAERDAENIVTKALAEKEHIFTEARNMAKSQAEEVIKKVKMKAEQAVAMYANIAKQRAEKIADEYRDECKKRVEQEAATIIDNANEQAIQIIAQAKERAKKQADEEKQEEVKRIMESARLEAAEIIEKAKQVAEKEAEEARKAQEAEKLDRKKAEEEEKRAKAEAEREAREKARCEAKEAKKAQEAEKLARKKVKAAVAESSETSTEAKDLEIEETGSDTVRQDNESLYTGKVEIDLCLAADKDIMAKLYRYLSRTPEVKCSRTVASSSNGIIVNVVLDKPLRLVEMLSSEITDAHVTGEPLNENGKKQKTRRINIVRKEAGIIPMEDFQV